MATDSQRVRLNGDGILSCRIKIAHPPHDSSQSPELANANLPTAVSHSMEVPLQPTSPSSRRKGKIVEAIQSMANLNHSIDQFDLPTDPDAQATVTDFLDFTEYLPSDMMRSLTLIGDLDQKYCAGSANVHDLTKTYGKLPDLPVDGRPEPIALRAYISDNLADASNARVLAHAEACRMAENVDRHYNRAKNILAKLQAMAEAYPPSREPTPVPQTSKSPVAARAPKITLRVDGGRSEASGPKVRKHRAPRITVPGEVLAPYELDYESYGSESDDYDSEDEELITPRDTPGPSLGVSSNKIKLKISKALKSTIPKPPRAPRPPGQMGTNVHSTVAGISTSNALAMLMPPPPDAVNGDVNRPWLALTDWELATLRKRMKKNAVWSPSDTMIARELKLLGRGLDAYRAVKEKADAAGQPMEHPTPPQLLGQTVDSEGAMSVEALGLTASQLHNKGMQLNEQKKMKKDQIAKDLAKQAAEEAEESALKMAAFANTMKGFFNRDNEENSTPAKTAGKSKAAKAKTPAKPPASNKRKRDSDAEETESLAQEEPATTVPEQRPLRPAPKRTKTETPVPVPIAIAPKESAPAREPATPSGTPAEAPTPRPLLERKPTDPILPPAKKPNKKELAQQRQTAGKEEAEAEAASAAAAVVASNETAVSSRPRRSSVSKAPTPTPAPAPAPEMKRPTSSRSKRESIEPGGTATIDRPRRTSTARNTPAPEPRQARRAKRPAPGVVTAGSEGSTTFTIGKRSAATRKKAGTKKEKKDGREGSAVQEVYDEIDNEGNIIDPDEARYCLCNRVSFGTMIGCENENCEKEWFHLECVGLAAIPPRTTKWYCPDCRVTLGIGEKGEVSARGKKK